MAGYTNWKIVLGGPDVDGDALRALVAEHALGEHDAAAQFGIEVTERLPSADATGTWFQVLAYDMGTRGFEEIVKPLLDAAGQLGCYWRLATEPRDDFDASWLDSRGDVGHWDAFADVATAATS